MTGDGSQGSDVKPTSGSALTAVKSAILAASLPSLGDFQGNSSNVNLIRLNLLGRTGCLMTAEQRTKRTETGVTHLRIVQEKGRACRLV